MEMSLSSKQVFMRVRILPVVPIMLDKEAKIYAEIIHKAYKEHGPVLYGFQVRKLTGLNERQVMYGTLSLLNDQVLTEEGWAGVDCPAAGFKLTGIECTK